MFCISILAALLVERVNDRQAGDMDKIVGVVGVQVKAVQQGSSGNQAIRQSPSDIFLI